jgi:hypothetical protein
LTAGYSGIRFESVAKRLLDLSMGGTFGKFKRPDHMNRYLSIDFPAKLYLNLLYFHNFMLGKNLDQQGGDIFSRQPH